MKTRNSTSKRIFNKRKSKSCCYKCKCKKCCPCCKCKKCKKTLRSRKLRGGTSFNDSFKLDNVTFEHVPLNTYSNTPQSEIIDSRLIPMNGGKSKRKRSKGKKVRRSKKMRGGGLIGTDLITGVSTSSTNDALAFGTTGGSEFMYQKLTGEPISEGSSLQPTDTMVPLV